MLTLKREMQKGIAILIGACRVQRYFNSGRSGIEALGSARGFGYIETVRRIKFSFRRGGDTNKQTNKKATQSCRSARTAAAVGTAPGPPLFSASEGVVFLGPAMQT